MLLVVFVLVIVISPQDRTMVSLPQVAALSPVCSTKITMSITSIQVKFIGHTVYSVPSIVILKYHSLIPHHVRESTVVSNPEDVQ